MRRVVTLLLVGLAISPAWAQDGKGQAQKQPTLIQQARPGVTYEDCVARCNKCGSGMNPDCVRNFCTGYPHRKRGATPLPVVCPETD